MIITLKGATFSTNIGTITTWRISTQLGDGAIYDGVTEVDRKEAPALSATITTSEGYKLDSENIRITMGGAVLEGAITLSEDSKSATINIASVTGHVAINAPTVVVPIALTNGNATTASTTQTVNTTQTIGTEVAYGDAGTKGILTWDIPAYAMITLTVASGGTYGIALTDADNIVLASTTNAAIVAADSNGVYTFAVQTVPTRLHVSTTKFLSAEYRILSEEEIKAIEYSISVTQSETAKYVAPKANQKVGSAVVYNDMTASGVYVSNPIPKDTQITVIVKSGGSYGIALCDTEGNVLEAKNNSDADADLLLVFSPQSVESVLHASKSKFTSASYKYV